MAQFVWEVNLEHGMPSADEALRRLEAELAASRRMNRTVVKLIHGYGSSGRGGRIRTACRKRLRQAQQDGQVQAVIPGEDLSIFNEQTRQAFRRCDALRQDRDLDRHNLGVTFAVF